MPVNENEHAEQGMSTPLSASDITNRPQLISAEGEDQLCEDFRQHVEKLEIDPEKRQQQVQKETNPSLIHISGLLDKCRRVLKEIDTFQEQLNKTLRNPQLVEIR